MGGDRSSGRGQFSSLICHSFSHFGSGRAASNRTHHKGRAAAREAATDKSIVYIVYSSTLYTCIDIRFRGCPIAGIYRSRGDPARGREFPGPSYPDGLDEQVF